MELWRQTGFDIGVAWALGNLAEMYQKSGRYEATLEYGAQALALLRPVSDSSTRPSLLLSMGIAHLAMDDPEAARAAWQEGLDLLTDQTSPIGQQLRESLARLDGIPPDAPAMAPEVDVRTGD